MLISRYDEAAKYEIESEFDEVNCTGLEYMWRNAYRASRAVDEKEDLVIRSRYDLFFFSGSDTLIEQGLALQEDEILIPAGGDHRGGVFDMFAVGSKRVMDYYHDLHRLIPKYYSEGVAMHSELLLRMHLERGGIKIIRPEVSIGFIRPSNQKRVFRANTVSGSTETLGMIDNGDPNEWRSWEAPKRSIKQGPSIPARGALTIYIKELC